MSLTSKFNQGKLTSTDIDREFNDEFVSKIMVEMAPRKKFFTNRGSHEDQPKHYGDQLTKVIQYPMIHKDNMNDGGLDASTAEIIQNTYYTMSAASYDAAGNYTAAAVTGEYDATDYLGANGGDIDLARTAAENAANASIGSGTVADNYANGKLKTGAGRILNGDASFAVAEGPLAPLPEEGGIVNLLNATSKLASAKITHHGIATRYTVRSQNLGSLPGQIGRKIKELSRAKGELQEMQVQNGVLAAGELNSMVASDIATTKAGVGPVDVVDYDALSAWEQSLMGDDVPLDTQIVDGTTNVDTKTVEDAYIVYINRELVPTLRKLTGPGGVNVWFAKSKYAAGTDLLDGEVGMIDGLAFRFVVVPDLQKYQGAGLLAVATDDAYAVAAGVVDKATYDAAAATVHSSGDNIDVFNMVVIGDDSFVTTSIAGSNTKAKHIMPTADVHNDIYGEVGGVSTKWSFGFLCYRGERISSLLTSSFKV